MDDDDDSRQTIDPSVLFFPAASSKPAALSSTSSLSSSTHDGELAASTSAATAQAQAQREGQAAQGDGSAASTAAAAVSATCPLCEPEDGAASQQQRAAKRRRRNLDTWIECDECQTWYHWACAAPNPLDPIEIIDKWYCPSHPGKVSTYKAAPRKSSRVASSAAAQVDYGNLHAHLPAHADRWAKAIAPRVKSGEIKDGVQARVVHLLDPKEAADVKALAMANGPLLVKTDIENILDLAAPGKKRRDAEDEHNSVAGAGGGDFVAADTAAAATSLSDAETARAATTTFGVQDVARLVGPETPVNVIDVASQRGLSGWTLGMWAAYFDDARRDKIRNVISLEVSHTDMADLVGAPKVVRDVDWVERYWPKDLRNVGEYPTVQKYCLMSVAKCWTDWHIDFAGSSVFYHIVRGKKTFYFIRPTAPNLAAYERWSGSEYMQENVWLGDECDFVYKVELEQGNTMIIPTGWIHSVYTPEDALVVGGNFLHSFNIPTQLRVYDIELATKVPRKFRFPHFVKLCWYVARGWLAEERDKWRARAKEQRRLASLATSVIDVDADDDDDALNVLVASDDDVVDRRVLVGIERLARFLREQTTRWHKDNLKVTNERRRVARENVPWRDIKDPEGLVRDVWDLVRRRLGKPVDVDSEEEAAAAASGERESSPVVARKRKTMSETPTPDASAVKPRGKPTAVGAPGSVAAPKRDEAEILDRRATPLNVESTRVRHVDPRRAREGEQGAERKQTRTSNTVVRRLTRDDGCVVLETRTVITEVEQIIFDGGEGPDASAMDLDDVQLVSATAPRDKPKKEPWTTVRTKPAAAPPPRPKTTEPRPSTPAAASSSKDVKPSTSAQREVKPSPPRSQALSRSPSSDTKALPEIKRPPSGLAAAAHAMANGNTKVANGASAAAKGKAPLTNGHANGNGSSVASTAPPAARKPATSLFINKKQQQQQQAKPSSAFTNILKQVQGNAHPTVTPAPSATKATGLLPSFKKSNTSSGPPAASLLPDILPPLPTSASSEPATTSAFQLSSDQLALLSTLASSNALTSATPAEMPPPPQAVDEAPMYDAAAAQQAIAAFSSSSSAWPQPWESSGRTTPHDQWH